MHRWASTSLISLLAAAALAAGPDAHRQAELRHLLEQDCGSCHGLTLRGGLGPALLPENLAGKPDAFLVQTILDGRPGTAMPPWRPLISETDAGWLVQRLLNGEAVR
ncbi:MAG: cytochrome c [Gammaproteobacteria bacterium]|nr:cytochrome c [Gammaproteobacteria bacterium]MCP5298584.1 cytochrome c [Chromatiaceae bacterium]